MSPRRRQTLVTLASLSALPSAFAQSSQPVSRLERPDQPGQHLSLRPSRFHGLAPRALRLWLPESFDKRQPYEVLLAHDGQNLFDPGHSYGGVPWGLDQTLARLVRERLIRQVVVIGVPNSPQRFEEYAPQDPLEALSPELWRLAYGSRSGSPAASDFPGLANRYLAFLMETVLPESLGALGLQEPAHGISLMGSSMGGLISLYGLCKYPARVKQAACLSTHWPMTVNTDLLLKPHPSAEPIAQSYRDWLTRHLPQAGMHRIYMDHGTLNLDSLYGKHQQQVNAIMKRKGYSEARDLRSLVFEGTDHNETSWAARLATPMQFLFS
ncbi:MAG: alpha/beta hydrolase [Burkholderiaceae bacterium]